MLNDFCYTINDQFQMIIYILIELPRAIAVCDR